WGARPGGSCRERARCRSGWPGRGRAPSRRRCRRVREFRSSAGNASRSPYSPRRRTIGAMTVSAAPPRDAAAFFDLDRTLLAGASPFIFGWVAWRKKLMGTRELLGDAARAVSFRLTGGSDDLSDQVRDRILAAVEGHPREDLTSLNDDLLPRLLNSVRPETRRVVERHHETGRDTYIVSASPIEIVDPLASALGMTGSIATESEVVDGLYTGRLLS